MQVSWEVLSALENLHGEAFYILDIQQFENNYTSFLNAFREIYPKTQLAYSYKTNYTPCLCQAVNRLGGYAEVVSGMEYEIAARIGVEGERIIFNGPYKTAPDIERALLAGSVVNLDSLSEVLIVEAIALRHPRTLLNFGVRCNFTLDGERDSRFGLDVCTGAVAEVFHRLARLPNCRILGLHCHFMTRERSASAYAQVTHRMLELAISCFGTARPRFIDIGGGFFSNMDQELRRQFPFHVPGFKEYAAAIASPFRQAYPDGQGPELILEPGLALVADAMRFVTKVVSIKKAGARYVALVTGSIYNVKPTLSRTNLPVTVYGAADRRQYTDLRRHSGTSVDFVGYTCMEDDCLYRGYTGPVHPGDFVVFDNAGAYTNVLKPPFINPSPPILAWGDGAAGFQVARRREEYADILATYAF